jgi:hypothetical protein
MNTVDRAARADNQALSVGWKAEKMSGAVAVVETAPPNVGRSANR